MSWITALKLVPWTDVIAAAPHVLKAARGLMGKDSKSPPSPSADVPIEPLPTTGEGAVDALLAHIQAQQQRIQALEARQQQIAEIAQNLAAQQEKVIQTVSLLRTGATRLAWLGGVALVVGLIALGVALWGR